MPTSSSHLKNHSTSAHALTTHDKTTKQAPKYYGKIIVIKRNGQDSASFELSDPNYLFGRAERCDIRIQLASIGEEHCRIFPEPGLGRFAMIQNLSSVGVSVNGVLLKDHKEHVLKCGDLITIVERSFRYENPFWSEEEKELVLEETTCDGSVKMESPIKAVNTPNKSTPVKQSTPMKSNNNSPLKSTPIKSSLSPIKQSPKLSTPKPQLTPTKAGSPIKTPSKSTPAREQMTVTPIKSNNSPKPSTPRLTTPMTVSQATPAQTQPSTPSAFAVSAVPQSDYQPQQSPSKFDVVMRTPIKSPTNQIPQSVTPVSQTKDIGKILPGVPSPSVHTPTQPQQQQQVTPQVERSAKSVGSAGYSALMNSGEKTEKSNEHPQSPIRGVIDHEITASPHLSPRIKMLASAHHETDEDVVMGSPSASKIQTRVELIDGMDQSAQDVEMIDSTDLLVETVTVEPIVNSESMTEIKEIKTNEGPTEEQVVEEVGEEVVEEKAQQQASADSAPQPMETEGVEAEAAVEEPIIESEQVMIARTETVVEDIEMSQEPVIEETEETIVQPIEPVEQVETIFQSVEPIVEKPAETIQEQPLCEVLEQSAVERPDIEMSEETTTMISEEQHFGVVSNDVITNDVLVNDEPMVLVETCSLLHDEPVVEAQVVIEPAEPEQPPVENAETQIVETETAGVEPVEIDEPCAVQPMVETVETMETVENNENAIPTVKETTETVTADIQMEPEESKVEMVDHEEIVQSNERNTITEQPSIQATESENIQQEAPLTPRRSSRLQLKSSNTSTPSKLSTEIDQVVGSATRRSTRKAPTASESVTRKSTRTPKIEVSNSTTKARAKAMSTGAVKQKKSLETEIGEENNDNSPSIQATRRSTRRTAEAVVEEDKENAQSANEPKKATARSKRSAELQSEPEMPTVRKSARTTRAK